MVAQMVAGVEVEVEVEEQAGSGPSEVAGAGGTNEASTKGGGSKPEEPIKEAPFLGNNIDGSKPHSRILFSMTG